MARYIDIKTAAERLGAAERTVRDRCIAGKLSGARKRNGAWQIPIAADVRLYQSKQQKNDFSSEELLQFPRYKRDAADEKMGAVEEFEEFSAAYVRGGGLRSEAFKLFAADNNIGKSTLQRWVKIANEEGAIGFIDTRGGDQKEAERISEEAFKWFKSFYLDDRQPSIKDAWDKTIYINKAEKRGWTIPQYRAMCRLVEKQIPEPALVYHRDGKAAYEAKCASFIDTDYESIKPGQIWVGDHHQFNCMIWHRGKWVRPWITAWEDMRSRTIVGHYISVSPNQTTILQAMKRGIKAYGPPDGVHIDNGRDYDSELWTGETKSQRKKRKVLKAGYLNERSFKGIYKTLGVKVTFAIPYHPQSKPIERWFDTLDMQFVKSVRTYCGKDSKRKPEGLNDYLKTAKAEEKAYTLDTFSELVGQYIEIYNNKPHSGKGVEGKTPAAVMKSRTSRRVLKDGVLDAIAQVWSGVLKVGKNGVRFKGVYYGQYNSELATYFGKCVQLSYDPDDISSARVYDAESGKLITIADQNKMVQYGTDVGEEHMREAHRERARATKRTKMYREDMCTLQMDNATLALRAAQRDVEKQETDTPAPALRPVGTVLDSEVGKAARRKDRIKLSKAAGAESMTGYPDLQLDFDVINDKDDYKSYGGEPLDLFPGGVFDE